MKTRAQKKQVEKGIISELKKNKSQITVAEVCFPPPPLFLFFFHCLLDSELWSTDIDLLVCHKSVLYDDGDYLQILLLFNVNNIDIGSSNLTNMLEELHK